MLQVGSATFSSACFSSAVPLSAQYCTCLDRVIKAVTAIFKRMIEWVISLFSSLASRWSPSQAASDNLTSEQKTSIASWLQRLKQRDTSYEQLLNDAIDGKAREWEDQTFEKAFLSRELLTPSLAQQFDQTPQAKHHFLGLLTGFLKNGYQVDLESRPGEVSICPELWEIKGKSDWLYGVESVRHFERMTQILRCLTALKLDHQAKLVYQGLNDLWRKQLQLSSDGKVDRLTLKTWYRALSPEMQKTLPSPCDSGSTESTEDPIVSSTTKIPSPRKESNLVPPSSSSKQNPTSSKADKYFQSLSGSHLKGKELSKEGCRLLQVYGECNECPNFNAIKTAFNLSSDDELINFLFPTGEENSGLVAELSSSLTQPTVKSSFHAMLGKLLDERGFLLSAKETIEVTLHPFFWEWGDGIPSGSPIWQQFTRILTSLRDLGLHDCKGALYAALLQYADDKKRKIISDEQLGIWYSICDEDF
jgi:hypothetical protein